MPTQPALGFDSNEYTSEGEFYRSNSPEQLRLDEKRNYAFGGGLLKGITELPLELLEMMSPADEYVPGALAPDQSSPRQRLRTERLHGEQFYDELKADPDTAQAAEVGYGTSFVVDPIIDTGIGLAPHLVKGMKLISKGERAAPKLANLMSDEVGAIGDIVAPKIKSAAVLVDGKMYHGQTHQQAMDDALEEGAMYFEGDELKLKNKDLDPYDRNNFNNDLFLTTDGRYIDRFQSSKEFDISSAESAIEKGHIAQEPIPVDLSKQSLSEVFSEARAGKSVEPSIPVEGTLDAANPPQGFKTAFKMKDGSVTWVDSPTHIRGIEKLGIDVDDIAEGGFVNNGKYSSGSADTDRYIQVEQAKRKVAERVSRNKKEPWQMSKIDYDSIPVPDKKPNDVFYIDVGGKKVEVIQNPTSRDYKQVSKETADKYGKSGVSVRSTQDEDGNRYIWPAYDAIHAQVEPGITRKVGAKVDQNAQKENHRRSVYDAIQRGDDVPQSVLADYADEDWVPKSTVDVGQTLKNNGQVDVEIVKGRLPSVSEDRTDRYLTQLGKSPKKPKRIYRGVNDDDTGQGVASLGEGYYTTRDKSFAKKFGDKVVDVDVDEAWPSTPLVLHNAAGGADGALKSWILSVTDIKNMRELNKLYPDIGVFVRELGFDGVVIGDEIVKYSDDVARTPQPVDMSKTTLREVLNR